MEIEMRTISNPRTRKGGWQDEEKGCSLCGNVASAYAGLTFGIFHLKICKSCLEERAGFINKAILAQTKTRV